MHIEVYPVHACKTYVGGYIFSTLSQVMVFYGADRNGLEEILSY